MADVLPLATLADRIVARMSRSELICEVHAQEQDLIAADADLDAIAEALWPNGRPAGDISASAIVIAIGNLQTLAGRLASENARLRAELGAGRA
jgi:hypothetical protein